MIDINLDTQQIDRRLADIERRARTLKPAFRELRKPMRLDQKSHARAAEGPDGAWPARAASTEARRKSRNRSLRQPKAARMISPKPSKRRSTPKAILGRLPRALAVVAGDLFVRATSRVSWAIAHQLGAHVGKSRRTRIPRRTFVWIGDGLIRTARDVLGNYIVKDWNR